jgi:hypothetical protein
MTSRTLLAERILKSAAKGERNPERLRDEALMLFAANNASMNRRHVVTGRPAETHQP